MTRLELIERCEALDACSYPVNWLRGLDVATAREAWDACDRANWMAWLAARVGLRDQAVSLACDYAERVLPICETWLREHAPEHAEAPRRAVEAARRGEVTRDVIDAARAASRAAVAAAAYDAALTAYAACAAASAAHHAHAVRAADAAEAAAHYAYAAAHARATYAAERAYWVHARAARAADVAAPDNVTAFAVYWAAYAAAADQRDNDATERAWQLARLREVIAWDDVERGLRGVA